MGLTPNSEIMDEDEDPENDDDEDEDPQDDDDFKVPLILPLAGACNVQPVKDVNFLGPTLLLAQKMAIYFYGVRPQVTSTAFSREELL